MVHGGGRRVVGRAALGPKDELAAEFADVLAWLATLANIAGVDLDGAVAAKYGGGLPEVCEDAVRVQRGQAVRGGVVMKMCETTPRLAATRRGARGQRAPLRVAAKQWGIALAVAACLAASARAQTAPSIERVRIGLPVGGAGQDDGSTRNGSWAPVAVTLRGTKDGNPRGVYRLRVETTDLQDIAYRASVAVPAMAAEGLKTVTGYIVPGGDGATFRVTVEDAEGRPIRSLAVPSRESARPARRPGRRPLLRGRRGACPSSAAPPRSSTSPRARSRPTSTRVGGRWRTRPTCRCCPTAGSATTRRTWSS